jgi:hypothetical protein
LAAEEVDEDDDAGPDLFGFEGDLSGEGITAARGASISGMIEMAGLRIWRSLVPSSAFTIWSYNLIWSNLRVFQNLNVNITRTN